jgi:poly(3-hydroxyalkanoate) depolymerase
LEVRTLFIAGMRLRVATSSGQPGSPPLLVFNGLGASLDVLDGFACEMSACGIGIITFDVPGIGGSSMPALPYRFSWLASLANQLLAFLEIAGQVDVAGLSWGGALAQEFTHTYPARVRRLVLAATSAGAVALPGRWSALSKLLGLRLYIDPDYLMHVGGEIYGGKIRDNPELLLRVGKVTRPIGSSLQLLAVSGWTSALWLHTLRQPTLVLMGTDDPIIPLANGRLLATLIPDARLVTIDDGHLFLLTSARECGPIIADFLRPQERPRARNGVHPAATAPPSRSDGAALE